MSSNTQNINYNNFKNICRTCLFNCDLKSIQQNKQIIEILHKLGVRFETNDELPQQICVNCFEKINEIREFSLRCNETYSSLMHCLNNYKNERLNQVQVKVEETKQETTNEKIKIKEEITIDEHKVEFVPVNNYFEGFNSTNLEIKQEIVEEINNDVNEDLTPETSDENINCSENDLLESNTSNIQVGNEEASYLNEMRKTFEEKLAGLVSRKKDNSTFLTVDQYVDRIRAVKEAKRVWSSKKGKKLPIHYWLLERFDVVNIAGKETLIKRIADESKAILYYVHQDELFDILHNTHLSIDHGGRNRMIQQLQRNYCNITRETIMVYLHLCAFCRKKKKNAKKQQCCYSELAASHPVEESCSCLTQPTENGTGSKCLVCCTRLESIQNNRKRAGECLEMSDSKLISLREMASYNSLLGSTSTSDLDLQAHKKCNCKTMCVSKKCACRSSATGQQLCNSRCHRSLPCFNK